ncbi:MAG: Muramoyltetrapeptide carboxypeptidase [Burkholderiaceae bacterium]|jgi:muramoyltetrapeptide carboxypeptidase|nr:MAG: Muramoyltetrapeptide carboxypeptidase [Burkholderiaceae bacterium]
MTKRIYIYSPSGAVRDRAAFRRGVARLRALGHEVEIDTAALASHLRFAGDDDTRLAAIHRAAASGADVALISRGGYGLTRLLDRIRYAALARAIDRGTQFVGISDFTALQLALLAKTERVTWAGPALCEGFGAADVADGADGHGSGSGSGHGPDEIMEACFDDMLTGRGEGAGWRQLREARGAVGEAAETGYRPFTLRPAVLWGGNLAVLCSLVGTPFLPQVAGGILFVEDIAEHPYRIERMLAQLLHAGVLARQKAIVLGQFTGYQLGAHDRGFRLQTVVEWLRGRLKIPVLTNLPFGHVQTKVLLPVGASVRLTVDDRDAFLLWGHRH